ncbi:hypothetical protein KUCAC02_027112, partial [Chaenocephalus aceratus]
AGRTATLTRGDSSSALGATTSSAVETAERVRQARTEASPGAYLQSAVGPSTPPPPPPPISSGTQFNFCHSDEASESVYEWREDLNLSLSLSVDISTGGFLILVLFTPPCHHLPL